MTPEGQPKNEASVHAYSMQELDHLAPGNRYHAVRDR